MRFEERVVTPEDAKKWLLNRAEENRDISESVVENYARQMKEGWWTNSSEPVAFRIGDEKLIDGQHRLSAIVRANIPIKLGIIWDSPTESFKNLNSGYSRTVAFRTNTPPFATQCYGLLLNMARGSSRLVAGEVELMHKLFSSYVERLKTTTSGRQVKFFGSAPIRAAALASLALGEKPSYILKTYGLLSTGNTDGISPVGRAFMTANNQNKLIPKGSRGGAYSRDLYLRARYVFDVRNAEKDIPKNFGSILDNYQNEVGAIVERALGKHFSSITSVRKSVRKAQEKLEKVVHNEPVNNRLTKQLARLIDSEQARLSMSAKD